MSNQPGSQRQRAVDVDAAVRRFHESIYRDPGVEDEHDPAFIATQLRGDADFDGSVSACRFPFDADRIESVIMHVQAGTETKVAPENIRRAFTTGTTGTDALDEAAASVLGELLTDDLDYVIRHSGASPREAAAFFRARGGFRWPVVWCLNAMTEAGPTELPFALEKQLLAGHFDFSERWM